MATRRPHIQWPVEQMREWYEVDQMSVNDIAKRLNENPKLVWKVCKKHGFRMRPIGSCPGPKNPAWKGGRTVDKCGYILVWMPDHPQSNGHGYIREHRLVAEKILGRLLLLTEVVHHKNDDPSDNRPENLMVYETNARHLAETLAGKCPNWTDDGKQRMKEASDRRRRKPAPPSPTDDPMSERDDEESSETIARPTK